MLNSTEHEISTAHKNEKSENKDCSSQMLYFMLISVEMPTVIGIKHVFLCINVCWTPRVMLKQKVRALTTPRGLADVSISEHYV